MIIMVHDMGIASIREKVGYVTDIYIPQFRFGFYQESLLDISALLVCQLIL